MCKEQRWNEKRIEKNKEKEWVWPRRQQNPPADFVLYAFCFSAFAQERVSRQIDYVSLVEVPNMPVSPGLEGYMDPLMFLRNSKWEVLPCAWLGCILGDGKRWHGDFSFLSHLCAWPKDVVKLLVFAVGICGVDGGVGLLMGSETNAVR